MVAPACDLEQQHKTRQAAPDSVPAHRKRLSTSLCDLDTNAHYAAEITHALHKEDQSQGPKPRVRMTQSKCWLKSQIWAHLLDLALLIVVSLGGICQLLIIVHLHIAHTLHKCLQNGSGAQMQLTSGAKKEMDMGPCAAGLTATAEAFTSHSCFELCRQSRLSISLSK